MASRRITPPWDYLHDASVPSLESYELSRLNHAANIRREIAALLDQWIEDSAQALLARWVREDRMLARSNSERSQQPDLPFSESESHTMSPRLAQPRRAENEVRMSRRSAG